jgi:hypothetical protein
LETIYVVCKLTVELIEESVEVGDFRINVAMGQLANGLLLLVSDGEYRFGTIAVGVPSPFSESSPVATSCLVGTRFQAEVRAIADVAAQKMGGIVLVNLFLSPERSPQISTVLMAVRQLLTRLDKNEQEF